MARLAPEDWLAQARARGGDALADLVLPDRRVEAWKYSRVGALLEEGLLDAVDGSAAVPDVPAIGESFDRLLFVDGRLRVVPDLPDGVTLVRSEVPSTTEDERPFAALNAALADEAWRLEVALASVSRRVSRLSSPRTLTGVPVVPIRGFRSRSVRARKHTSWNDRSAPRAASPTA